MIFSENRYTLFRIMLSGNRRSIRIRRLRLLRSGGRRLDGKLRVRRQHTRAGRLRGLTRSTMTRLLSGFDFRRVPAVPDKERQYARAYKRNGERNRRQACSGVPMAHISDPDNQLRTSREGPLLFHA
jgi:hypothetical protein